MKKSEFKKFRSIEARRARTGFYFILPWIIGIILFFLSPLVQSISFSFSDVKLGASGGLDLNFMGLENYKYILLKDGDFNNNLRYSITEFAYSMPIIVILSLVFACVLNQKFKGRLFARALFFMPVIIASGVVMQMINSTGYGEPVSMSLGSTNSYMGYMIDFNDVLGKMGFSLEIIDFFSLHLQLHKHFASTEIDENKNAVINTPNDKILEAINSSNLNNTLGVVIRYFGGIKLGVGPLSRCYFKVIKEAINESEIIEIDNKITIFLETKLDNLKLLNSITKDYEVINKLFNEKITYEIKINKNDLDTLKITLENTNIKVKES